MKRFCHRLEVKNSHFYSSSPGTSLLAMLKANISLDALPLV